MVLMDAYEETEATSHKRSFDGPTEDTNSNGNTTNHPKPTLAAALSASPSAKDDEDGIELEEKQGERLEPSTKKPKYASGANENNGDEETRISPEPDILLAGSNEQLEAGAEPEPETEASPKETDHTHDQDQPLNSAGLGQDSQQPQSEAGSSVAVAGAGGLGGTSSNLNGNVAARGAISSVAGVQDLHQLAQTNNIAAVNPSQQPFGALNPGLLGPQGAFVQAQMQAQQAQFENLYLQQLQRLQQQQQQQQQYQNPAATAGDGGSGVRLPASTVPSAVNPFLAQAASAGPLLGMQGLNPYATAGLTDPRMTLALQQQLLGGAGAAAAFNPLAMSGIQPVIHQAPNIPGIYSHVNPVYTLGRYPRTILGPGGYPMTLPAILAQPEDSLKLSSHQVLLRHQIEAFRATDDDVSTHTRGRNKPIAVGQVGIRCRHCSHLPVARRQKGSTYFPATLLGLYQAAQNMSTTHMQCGLCTEMPDEIKQQFVHLMASKVASSGAGRPYWAQSAKKLGLLDSEDGIRFIRDCNAGTRSLDEGSRI